MAVNRNKGLIESCIVGTDSKSYAVHCLLSVINNCKNKETNKINIVATDGNYAYDKVINYDIFKPYINKHIIDKSETCLVESYNSSMRDRLARLGRRTKAYSKSKEMLELSLILWIERKNTGRTNWKKFLYI